VGGDSLQQQQQQARARARAKLHVNRNLRLAVGLDLVCFLTYRHPESRNPAASLLQQVQLAMLTAHSQSFPK
jgi:hypothetical protein